MMRLQGAPKKEDLDTSVEVSGGLAYNSVLPRIRYQNHSFHHAHTKKPASQVKKPAVPARKTPTKPTKPTKPAVPPRPVDTMKDFKDALRAGEAKFGIFVNSHSPTVAEQFAHAGYDWLLVDCQHGPMDSITMSAMLCAIQNGGAKSMVRVAGYDDRNGIQQALDLGADGILIPYINNAEEAAAGVSCCLYPFGKAGTRSVYFPQRSMDKQGLLGYAGGKNDDVLIALQVETADCITNMEEICAVPRVDLLFLGQNDLCVSMGLFDGKYEFPAMYQSPELAEATNKLITCANEKDILLGMFQFGTDRVTEFLDKGFNFISVGNDLHHALTQNFAHKEALVAASVASNKAWTPRHTNMPFGGEGALAGHNPSPADVVAAPAPAPTPAPAPAVDQSVEVEPAKPQPIRSRSGKLLAVDTAVCVAVPVLISTFVGVCSWRCGT